MTMRPMLLLAPVLALAGCATLPGGTPPTRPEPCQAPLERRAAADTTDHRASELALAGLRPLALDTLPSDVREIRIRHGASFVGTTTLLRVQATPSAVSGELILYVGSIADTHPDSQARIPLRCRKRGARPGRAACTAEFSDPVSWAAVLEQMERQDVWSLPSAGSLPRVHVVMDGHGIEVEVRQGACYRSYQYGNPESETIPEYRKAAALLRLVLDLRQQWEADTLSHMTPSDA
jgi:hypothetical protein